MISTKIKPILLFIILSLFQQLQAELPPHYLSIDKEEEIIEIAQRLKLLESIWLLIPLAESFENAVIQKMATTARWKALRNWRPPTFEEYLQRIDREGLKIRHQEPHRLLLQGPTLLYWLVTELAPRLGLYEWERQEFADEFLTHYGHDSAISRQLLSQLALE